MASRLLPGEMRPHVAALYAFARIADDIADEGSQPPSARQSELREWQMRLHDAVRSAGVPRSDHPNDPILAAVAHSIRSLDLPLTLFDDLVSAFGQDTTTTRYDSWADVLDYCRRSANPVGRLVLRIAGYRHEELDRSSDALCTALQLTNFWQDLGRDWHAGRLYVPRETYEHAGAREDELSRGPLTPAWQRAIESCVAFTRARFADGRLVCDSVRGRLRFELRFTWLGGHRILDQVERGRSELLDRRPALGVWDVPALVWRAASWRAAA